MEHWNLKINKSPDEVIQRLESELHAIGGFVFDKKNSSAFSFRKRVLYAWYLAFQNWTTVDGILSTAKNDTTTNVKISFQQHFLIRLIIATHLVLGLGLILGLFMSTNNGFSSYILGGLVIALGIIIWIATNRKFKKDAKKYKALISEIIGGET